MEGSYSKGHIRRFAKLSDVLVSIRPLHWSFPIPSLQEKTHKWMAIQPFIKLKVSRWVLLKRATIMVTPLRCSSFCPRRYTHPMLTCISLLTNPMVCSRMLTHKGCPLLPKRMIFWKSSKTNSLYIEDIVDSKIVPKRADVNVAPKTTTRPLYSHWKYPQCYMYRWCQLFHVMISFGASHDRYPKRFNSKFEFRQNWIQFNIRFNIGFPKFNSNNYSIQK